MRLKIKYITIIIIIVIFFGIFYISNSFMLGFDINLDLFSVIAENKSSCSDIRNELYLINDDIVFWFVEGRKS